MLEKERAHRAQAESYAYLKQAATTMTTFTDATTPTAQQSFGSFLNGIAVESKSPSHIQSPSHVQLQAQQTQPTQSTAKAQSTSTQQAQPPPAFSFFGAGESVGFGAVRAALLSAELYAVNKRQRSKATARLYKANCKQLLTELVAYLDERKAKRPCKCVRCDVRVWVCVCVSVSVSTCRSHCGLLCAHSHSNHRRPLFLVQQGLWSLRPRSVRRSAECVSGFRCVSG